MEKFIEYLVFGVQFTFLVGGVSFISLGHIKGSLPDKLFGVLLLLFYAISVRV